MRPIDIARNTETGDLYINGIAFKPDPSVRRVDVDDVFWHLNELQSEVRQWRKWAREMMHHLKSTPRPPASGDSNG